MLVAAVLFAGCGGGGRSGAVLPDADALTDIGETAVQAAVVRYETALERFVAYPDVTYEDVDRLDEASEELVEAYEEAQRAVAAELQNNPSQLIRLSEKAGELALISFGVEILTDHITDGRPRGR